TDPSKTSNTSTNFNNQVGAFTQMLLLLPGESVSYGSMSGKSGTPTVQTAGTNFVVTMNAADACWNTVTTITDTVSLSSTDAYATVSGVVLPNSGDLVSGTRAVTVTPKTAASQTFTVADVTDPNKPSNASTVTVNAGAYSKLQP